MQQQQPNHRRGLKSGSLNISRKKLQISTLETIINHENIVLQRPLKDCKRILIEICTTVTNNSTKKKQKRNTKMILHYVTIDAYMQKLKQLAYTNIGTSTPIFVRV